MPADVQYMGKDAVISFALSQVDTAVLASIEALGQATEGLVAQVGTLMQAGKLAFSLRITSQFDQPYTFPICKLRSHRERRGTQYGIYDMQFYAWVPMGNTLLSAGQILYVRA